MREKGSWCGETHLQKALYLAQELLEVPTGFDFILYKHGPFSFDLRDELSTLRADRLLRIEPQPRPFGPRFITTKRSEKIESLFPKTMRSFDAKLDFVTDKIEGKGVADLERLATALYVTIQYEPSASLDNHAVKLNELKPHISLTEAQKALERVSEFQKQAQAILS